MGEVVSASGPDSPKKIWTLESALAEVHRARVAEATSRRLYRALAEHVRSAARVAAERGPEAAAALVAMLAADIPEAWQAQEPAVEPIRRARAEANRVAEVVARYYRVPLEVFFGNGRNRSTTRARHVAAWLLRESGLSYPEIGAELRRDHSTTMYAYASIAAYLEGGADEGLKLAAEIAAIRVELARE